jgi:DNA-binding XRE family transcriptional regulator
MKLKKTELARRLDLRYATLLDWEKNRPEVYKRLVLSYEYERIINEMTDMLQKMQSNISHIEQGDRDGSCTKYGI